MSTTATITQDDPATPLPHALGPEKSILSSCLQDPAEWLAVAIAERLRASHFHVPAHGIIFETLVGIHEAGGEIELVSLVQTFLDRGLLDRIGGPSALTDLYTYAPSPGSFRHHLATVRKKFTLRRLITAGNDMIAGAYENPEEADEQLDQAEARILAIRETGQAVREVSLSSVVSDVADEIHRTMRGEEGQAGVPTGFDGLDRLAGGGLKPGEMFVIAARPSMGKTALMMNIIEAAAIDRGEAAAAFSLEMSAHALVRRMVLSRGRIDSSAIQPGTMADKGTLQRIQRAALEIDRAPLFIDDTSSLSITELRAKARRRHRSHPLRLLAIDYLQLMRSTSRQAQGSREREIAEISAGLKALAKELGIPVIVLAQLNRGPESRSGKNVGRPRLSDLRESGAIEQDADLVGLLYRPAYYAESDDEKEASAGYAELILAKNRNGATGTAPLTFIEPLARFENGAPERRPTSEPKTRGRWDT